MGGGGALFEDRLETVSRLLPTLTAGDDDLAVWVGGGEGGWGGAVVGRAGWGWGLVGGSVKLPEKKNYWETFRKTIKRGEVSICCD